MAISLPTLEGTQMELGDDSLAQLRVQLRGEALTPSDLGYDRARVPFNAMHRDRPGLIVRCTGTLDVVDAVNFAREHGIEVAVRGGGHSIAGLSSSDGGMVIDLSPMRGVAVDPEARMARVQGGALWGDVDRETQAFGLATPGGVVSDTGVAGLTLGGGYGWLRRKYGLSCDNVLGAQVVGADGHVRTASAEVNPDLFWAIRGGGGNFGIVTSFTFRLHRVGPAVASAVTAYPVADAVAVLRAFRDFGDRAPDDVSAFTIAITPPADPLLPAQVHEQPCLAAVAVFAGDPEQGMSVLQPLRELSTPLADISAPMPFTVVQSVFDSFYPRGQLQSYWKSLYLPELSDQVIELIAQKAQERPAPRMTLGTLLMGGAVNRVGPEDTAFSERSAPYMVSLEGGWADRADNPANIAWIRQTWSEIGEFGTGSTYLNFTGRADESTNVGVGDAFGKNLRRLTRVKAAYDPDNFFRLNNNILPAP
jgi:FAD/FMN-containing dehydrogenase